MKQQPATVSNLPYIAAFVIGVILFAVLWEAWIGSANSYVILAGMAGVAISVARFWMHNKTKTHSRKDK